MKEEKADRRELQKQLKQNQARQEEISCEIERLHAKEEDWLSMFRADRDATERLHEGWQGPDAEKYISESLEENRRFQTKYMQAFEEAEDRLDHEMHQLRQEEKNLSDSMDESKSEKQTKEREKWDE